MPLDTIYLTRHGHRLNWTIDLRTGTYISQFPTPTGNPVDPALTAHGVRQSWELGRHINSPQFHPKPFRVYSSPFYRCLQTIQPSVAELKARHSNATVIGPVSAITGYGQIEPSADFDVRIENGIGEWFGPTTFFEHPAHPTPETKYKPLLYPSRRGETILELHNRVATTLEGIIADVDAEIAEVEASMPPEQRTSKSLLICAHAAPLIAMGRVLTGRIPEDTSEEDFCVFTAGLNTFQRRGFGGRRRDVIKAKDRGQIAERRLAEGTVLVRAKEVPDWMGGRGVGGGWDCVVNGDCSFLSGGAERGWHFNGEEGFDASMGPPNGLCCTSW
ncbi:hypothetical protein N7468_007537 [Penicillium chermesinum]|uniref:Phosphoglycerate mutase family protein n=1 Tax=Penicillium chermesinum TaxID=63820 RepID=A0A9W9NUK6_9EURO|nr:uncharacterized protein N7468_007537 [Penicillium chermesinum]KAJ5226312.1 hypothetical protein N7468_007537 [Penicillium chermesinum]